MIHLLGLSIFIFIGQKSNLSTESCSHNSTETKNGKKIHFEKLVPYWAAVEQKSFWRNKERQTFL